MTLRINDGSGVAKRAVRMRLYDGAGAEKVIAFVRINDAGGVARLFYRRQVSVSVSPQAVDAYKAPGTGMARTSPVIATAANGTAPYVYSWASLYGSGIVADTPGSASTTFSGFIDGDQIGDVFRVTVTDAGGLTASADVDVTLYRVTGGNQ